MSEPKRNVPGSVGREARLDAAVAEYEQALRAGTPLDRPELVKRFADVAAELEEYISNQEFVAKSARGRLVPSKLPVAFGRYELRERIGQGGMGVVFKAYDPRLRRLVALKTLDRAFANELDLERFQREAETAANLKHPHIVSVHEVGDCDGQPYYTMTLVEGSNLQTELGAFEGRERDAVELVATIAEAVHDAHRAGIVHRDLKPANVLLDAAGKPYVADFGLAKRADGDALTATGDVLGTIEYMAPEQAAGDPQGVGATSDVYSLGVILYVLLTGRLPISGRTRAETARLLQSEEPRAPTTADGQRVHADLAAVCLKCLEKQPGARYPSTLELAQDLRRFLAGEAVLARKPSRIRAAARAVRRHPQRLAIALLLAFLMAYAWNERSGRRAQILENHRYTARQVGRELLERLQRWGDAVALASRDPELRALLAARRSASLLAGPNGPAAAPSESGPVQTSGPRRCSARAATTEFTRQRGVRVRSWKGWYNADGDELSQFAQIRLDWDAIVDRVPAES